MIHGEQRVQFPEVIDTPLIDSLEFQVPSAVRIFNHKTLVPQLFGHGPQPVARHSICLCPVPALVEIPDSFNQVQDLLIIALDFILETFGCGPILASGNLFVSKILGFHFLTPTGPGVTRLAIRTNNMSESTIG